MFASLLRRCRRVSRPRPHSYRPALEALEDRRLLTNYLILDFSPDTGRSWFSQAFTDPNLTTRRGYRPAFLDFNGDGYVNGQDVDLAARAVANRAAQLLRGFDIRVHYGDVQQNTNWGRQWLDYGTYYRSEQVFVIYVGGYSGKDGGGSWVLGEAYQPPVGYVKETYGNVYASSATDHLLHSSGATRQAFVDEVACAAVHEFGHLVGLGHVKGNPRKDPYQNIMNYSANHSKATIPNATYTAIELQTTNGQSYYGRQNPAQELAHSLAGEPSWLSYGYNTRLQTGPLHSLAADARGRWFEREEGHHRSQEAHGPTAMNHDASLALALHATGREHKQAVDAVFARL